MKLLVIYIVSRTVGGYKLTDAKQKLFFALHHIFNISAAAFLRSSFSTNNVCVTSLVSLHVVCYSQV